jgi:hypothetical protein
VHVVKTPARATAAEAAAIIRDECLQSGAGFPYVLVVDPNPNLKFTSEVFSAFVKRMGSCLIVGSAYHKNTNIKVERTNGVISDTLRPYSNGREDDWDVHLLPAEFAINNAASTFGDGLTPSFIDCGAHQRLPLSRPRPPGHTMHVRQARRRSTTRRMHEIEATVRELLAAEQVERKAKLDVGRHGIHGGGPGAASDQRAARRRHPPASR